MQGRTDAGSSMNDIDLRAKDRSFGLMMPAKVRTMRDYEQQLNVLRKENLHLRLRMFFLEQGKGRQCSVSTGGEYEAFVQQVQNDMKTLVNEVDKRNALIQKNWVTIEQQHEAIERLTEEKLAAEKDLFSLQTKTLLAEGAHKDCEKMANMISELEQQKKQLEQDMKALRKRLGELEEHDIPGMRKEIDKRNIAIQGLTVQVVKKDKAIRVLESQVSMLSSTQPLTDTFLERLDRSLANSDVDSAVAARDQFRHDFSSITSRKKNSSDASAASSVALSALKEQVASLEAELRMKEAAIESMDTGMAQMKSALRASQEQCRDLESEMERSTQVHMKICAEKDKLLESLQNRVHQLQENAQEVQTLKNRQSALERECNSLHAALHEKANFIEELLAERSKAVFDAEKSFQELIHSMRQKDECIEVLQTKLKEADVETHYSAIASQSECSFLDPAIPKSDHHEDPKEARSFNLIELSTGEDSILKAQDTAKPDTESLETLNQGSSSKLLPIDRDLIEELSEFYEILCKASQDIEVLSEVKEPTVTRAECSSELRLNFVKELKSTLQHVCERGFSLVARSEGQDGLCVSSGTTVATKEGTDNKMKSAQICSGDQLDPALSEKLGEILTVLSVEPTAESSSGWHIRDLLSHLDLFLQKIKSNDSELSQCLAVQEKEIAQLKENKLLCERLLGSIAAISKVKSSEQGMGTELSDIKEGILRELAPVLECVNFLRDDVDTISASTGEKQDRYEKKSSSIEELMYMVDESGRLVPVPGSAVPSPEPRAYGAAVNTKDIAQQTEDAATAEELEQLRNELNKSRAQVKFLQKSLKESFSVRMTDSNRPLIEIDQNRPVPDGSPNKSANRRWRKQLTNQKMSEFGLSENVFELQEEIFFLVLRIEDLERQLGRGSSAMPHERSEKPEAPTVAEPKAKALRARCEALEQQVQDMQEASAVLLCRLEELAAFLEQLLQFDESGAFGSISLPRDTVARMRQLVADSRDFSLSVSQSILGGSDTGSILSEHSVFKASAQKELHSSAPAKTESANKTKTVKKFDPKDIPPQDEDVIFMEEELTRLRDQVQQQQEEIFELSKRLNNDTSCAPHAHNTSEGMLLSPPSPQSRKHPGTPASHYDDDDATDASWRYQDQVVVVQASDSDDILLLLNDRGLPENVYFRSTWEKKSLLNKVSESNAQLDAAGKQSQPVNRTLMETAHAEDEDADESSSSTPPSRKRVEEGKEGVLPTIGRFQCYSSDSDIWSEPDRSVSEQRMGGISCSGWNKHLRRSPKTPRKAGGGMTRTEREEESEMERKGLPTRDTSWRSTESGRSKRTSQSTHSQLQRLEKLLRRMQGCSAKLEDALTSHKELCQKMLECGNSDTSRESVEQVQLPSSELIDTHIQTMRKLQFKLEETVINNELLREILTERVESGSIIKPETISTSASSPEVEVAQKLQQYSKELECKERREEILKRAIANEQAAKLQLEKELLESHKELQVLHDAHSKLEESFKQYGTIPNTGFDTHLQATLREVQDWNLRLQKENEEKSRRACELEAVLGKVQAQYAELTADLQEKNIQLEFATKEAENLKGSGNHNEIEELKAMLKDRVDEIEEISCTVRALHEEVTHLRSEKMLLSHKLEATHKDHEVLLESSSNKISELVMKLGPLSVQNKNQLDEIRSLKEVNAALQAELDTAVSKVDALHQELETLDFIEKDNSDLKDSIRISKNQEISLRDKLQRVVCEFQVLRKTSEESRHSEMALKEETENLSTKVLRLTTQVEELEAESEELRADLQQLETERRTAHEKEWNAVQRGREFEQMVEGLQRELQGTRSKLEDMESRCIRLEKELSCSNETQQQLVSANRELQMLLESKSEQLREVEASNRDLQHTLIQQGANKVLERKHVMAFQELEDQNRSLQSQVVELRAKVDQVCHHRKLSSLEKSLQDHSHSRCVLGRYSRSPPRSSHEPDGHQAHSNAPSIQEGGSLCHSRSHHTSPDLGIDSDPMPERDDGNESAPIAGGFEEHWQHRMGANWSVTSIQSAPEAIGACPLCQQQGAPENAAKGKLNWTFAGEALDHLMDESPSKNVFPSICSAPSMTGMRMCAVVQLVDHELLKKRVDESICLVRRLEGTVQQLLDVLMELAPDFDEASNSKGLLQDALTGCHSIRVCLVESFRLICSFTISPIPDAKDECHQRCCYENKQLKDELTSLSEKHSKQSIDLQNALDQISTFKEKKEGMERAISRQLNKTKMVLKQTKGNLNVLRNKDPKQEKK